MPKRSIKNSILVLGILIVILFFTHSSSINEDPFLLLTPSPLPIPVISPLKTKIIPTAYPIQNMKTEIMAWLYPGNPSCEAKIEYQNAGSIDILKPEYFRVGDQGDLDLLTEKEYGCDGYSPENVSDIKKYSKKQYITISSSFAGSMDIFLKEALKDTGSIDRLVAFIKDNNVDGVELDFEDFGGWTQDIYLRYKQFVGELGERLHSERKYLMIDGPAVSNKEEEGWFSWRYEDFLSLPVDHIVVMAYDYQFDHGSGKPIAPIFWIKDVIQWVMTKFPAKEKITIGIPSYGYRAVVGTQKFTILSYAQINKEPGFETAVRDPESHEMSWSNGGNIYFYQDEESILKKRQAVEDSGMRSISVWSLGGNPWSLGR